MNSKVHAWRELLPNSFEAEIFRKAVSTMLHSLPAPPFSDEDLHARILHSREAWPSGLATTCTTWMHSRGIYYGFSICGSSSLSLKLSGALHRTISLLTVYGLFTMKHAALAMSTR